MRAIEKVGAILGVDIGGTFTDFALIAGGEIRVFKNSSAERRRQPLRRERAESWPGTIVRV